MTCSVGLPAVGTPAVFAVGLIGAYSTQAAAAIAPAIVAVLRTTLRIVVLLDLCGTGSGGRDSQCVPPFSRVCNLDHSLLGRGERIGFPARALHRPLHEAAILLQHAPEVHGPLDQLP